MITINAISDTTLYMTGKYCEENILIKIPEIAVGDNMNGPMGICPLLTISCNC